MLIDFFLHLKASKLPVSTREYLTLLEAMQARLAGHSIDDFYILARACLVKDESLYDKFDQAFGVYFKGVEAIPGLVFYKDRVGRYLGFNRAYADFIGITHD